MISSPDRLSVGPDSHDDVLDSVFLSSVCEGLSRSNKSLPCKYFYDATGSRLFDQICELPEYYPTRCESQIMLAHSPAIAAELRGHDRLIELGSGSSQKTRALLAALPRPLTYVPVDISGDHLMATAERLRLDFPSVDVRPICGDFTRPISALMPRGDQKSVVYFPGSTIGNFEPADASRLLEQTAKWAGPQGSLLIGFDLEKDVEVLCQAYDDAAGVTARFNQNLLVRINRELGGDFDHLAFNHQAIYNPSLRRMEMRLVSDRDQRVRVAGRSFDFVRGESIHTENSHKYSIDRFTELASGAGWEPRKHWIDSMTYFCVMLLDRC